jgi:hypothetical protein
LNTFPKLTLHFELGFVPAKTAIAITLNTTITFLGSQISAYETRVESVAPIDAFHVLATAKHYLGRKPQRRFHPTSKHRFNSEIERQFLF